MYDLPVNIFGETPADDFILVQWIGRSRDSKMNHNFHFFCLALLSNLVLLPPGPSCSKSECKRVNTLCYQKAIIKFQLN